MRLLRAYPAYSRSLVFPLDELLWEIRGDSVVRKSISVSGNSMRVNGVEYDISDRVHLVGFGKASAEMALGMVELLGHRVAGGIVNTNHHVSLPGIRVNITEHPYPGELTVQGSRAILRYLAHLGPEDTVIFLVSGGASSLFEVPTIPLHEYRDIMRHLVLGGASIEEINRVRIYLSEVKGGKLMGKFSATGLSLILSDVLSSPSLVGSAPTICIEVARDEVEEILHKYGISSPLPHARARCSGRDWDNVILMDNMHARHRLGELLGAHVVEEPMVEELNAVAKKIASLPPGLHVLGGEPTVRVSAGAGKGGRNQELALLLSLILDGEYVFLSIGTDGIDGNTEVAGAAVNGYTAKTIRERGMEPRKALQTHDSYSALRLAGAHLVTGHTGTNVSDLMIIDKKG